jgi:hypothetical protein
MKNGNEGIFSHINEKSEKINKIRNSHDLSYKEQKELIQLIQDSTITTFRDTIIFEGKFADFRLDSYDKPIIFKHKGLYGFFPQQTFSKYKSISEFQGFFAEVTFANGDQGWVDIYGNEFKKGEE